MKINIIKVGNDTRPAGPADIEDIKKQLEEAIEKNRKGEETALVVHHAIEHEIWEIDESNKGNETVNQEKEVAETILSPADLLEI